MKILESEWTWGLAMIFLKRWKPFYDAHTKRMDIKPIWVKTQSLPIEL
jgi:hypothetical protein